MHLQLQDRLKLLLWKIAAEAIPVKAPSFLSLGSLSDTTTLCPFCQEHAESILHVFHGCQLARALWSLSAWPLAISRFSFACPADWIRFILHAGVELGFRPSSLPSFILNAALILDVLWFPRNKAVHEGKPVVLNELKESLSHRFSDYFHAWSSRCATFSDTWTPPDLGCLKINFEVAVCQERLYTAVSVRDSSSSLCTVYMERIRAVDPLVGEATAAIRAVEIALSEQWSRVIFESDSKLLCADVSQPIHSPCWKIEDLVLTIHYAFKSQSAWALHWVPRRLNQQAHLLAQ